ncbi:MAG: beta-ketoacyl-ACP synthase 3 [Gammaproteobacteria bacterium]|jgi:3-oxoacyl-[acyl-carrier-protein] synthase-3|nr:beta-ketoacyl-ACP synthase 3 [Gammaproteobacteria bacterium]
MSVFIKAIEYYLPTGTLDNATIHEQFPEWSVDKISEKTGIKKRKIAAPQEFSSDLAIKAAEKFFQQHAVNPKEIDFILLCTQSPDYFLPTTACIIQDKLGIPTTAGALDFNLGCSGFVYGLALAKGLIATNSLKNVLLLTAETYSKFINPHDKSNRTIFGDGAAATLVCSTQGQCQIEDFVFGTDGRGAENLILKKGGMRYKEQREERDEYLYMNGPAIFNFTLSAVPSLIEQTLNKHNLKKEDIDLFVFHQANRFMLEAICKKIGIPNEKFFVFLENCGNTVSSTIPIALYEAMAEKKICPGSKVLLAGFGVGYSWAGTVLQF